MDPEPQAGALSAVFVAHRAQLLRVATRFLGAPELADDIVHEAFIRTLGMARGGARQPLAYACQVVRNLAIDHCRLTAREARLFAADGDTPAEHAGAGTPECIAAARQHLSRVTGALDMLPERTRHAFELHRLDGLSQRDVGLRLGVSATTVNFWCATRTHPAGRRSASREAAPRQRSPYQRYFNAPRTERPRPM
ncbi:sigma-70 family RNA polymerase sigma factor [Pseudoduganella sp. SL102]|uniref:sigma-70 family RNA polymerase sigma factor n=1 Tax=Pseudoduganella sp. SL102 TaxID=2995154 RepID=UPI00248AF03F|nr:sigma-70 family RNA polymerase sigma factor [Pseudoduganella sp. SL102]WBS04856.1 sigma-70 family RNA polymerase sigma factor [Pseudoduganella sp. SL102]